MLDLVRLTFCSSGILIPLALELTEFAGARSAHVFVDNNIGDEMCRPPVLLNVTVVAVVEFEKLGDL